ncbi:MarR family winged helix-turn-helix transcriptional regulator [Chloroflexota bacterium]
MEIKEREPEGLQSNEGSYALWELLAQTHDLAIKTRTRSLRKYNLSSIRAEVFSAIEHIGDKATPAEISRKVSRKPHTVSELLRRMEEDALVIRVKDLERKNMVRVVPTEKGRHAYGQAAELDTIHRILSSLSEEESQQLTSLLLTLRDKALEEYVFSETELLLR